MKLSFDRRGGIFLLTEKQHSDPFRNCCAQSHKVLPDSQIVPASLKFRRSFYRRYFPEAEDLAHWFFQFTVARQLPDLTGFTQRSSGPVIHIIYCRKNFLQVKRRFKKSPEIRKVINFILQKSPASFYYTAAGHFRLPVQSQMPQITFHSTLSLFFSPVPADF